MKGTASEETPPVNSAGTASSATPKTSTPAVDAAVSRDSGEQHVPPRVENRGAQRQGDGAAAQECSGSFIDSVSGASM